jgi:Spy/CpxP family protein refolding chaperone
MFRCLGAILICAAILSAHGQSASSKFQPGTITEVVAHQNAPGESSDVARYDVSVKVGNTVYKVLYTPPNGANGVKYSAGLQLLVSVGTDTLAFNSRLSGTTVVPILSRQTLPPQNALDLSKVPSQYFTMKQQHLSETLNLSEDQQAKIKPILEQETGEVGQIFSNPVISSKDKLNRWEKIVQSSDVKIKPFLSDEQVQKLQAMRKQQMQELKKLIAEPKAGNQS